MAGRWLGWLGHRLLVSVGHDWGLAVHAVPRRRHHLEREEALIQELRDLVDEGHIAVDGPAAVAPEHTTFPMPDDNTAVLESHFIATGHSVRMGINARNLTFDDDHRQSAG